VKEYGNEIKQDYFDSQQTKIRGRKGTFLTKPSTQSFEYYGSLRVLVSAAINV
jgi:hypothetical protein